MWLSPPLPTLKHYSSVGHQASPPGSSHYWVALNLTSLPPSTTSISHAKLPKESEPCTHTHTCTHTRTYVLPPLTMETPISRSSAKAYVQGWPSLWVQALQGPKAWRQERVGSPGRISPRSETGERGPETLGGRTEKKIQSRKDAVR